MTHLNLSLPLYRAGTIRGLCPAVSGEIQAWQGGGRVVAEAADDNRHNQLQLKEAKDAQMQLLGSLRTTRHQPT
jgi:hypothetical protein